ELRHRPLARRHLRAHRDHGRPAGQRAQPRADDALQGPAEGAGRVREGPGRDGPHRGGVPSSPAEEPPLAQPLPARPAPHGQPGHEPGVRGRLTAGRGRLRARLEGSRPASRAGALRARRARWDMHAAGVRMNPVALAYGALALAIVCEVTGSAFLLASEQFTRAGPTLGMVAFYAASFWFLSQALAVVP